MALPCEPLDLQKPWIGSQDWTHTQKKKFTYPSKLTQNQNQKTRVINPNPIPYPYTIPMAVGKRTWLISLPHPDCIYKEKQSKICSNLISIAGKNSADIVRKPRDRPLQGVDRLISNLQGFEHPFENVARYANHVFCSWLYYWANLVKNHIHHSNGDEGNKSWRLWLASAMEADGRDGIEYSMSGRLDGVRPTVGRRDEWWPSTWGDDSFPRK